MATKKLSVEVDVDTAEAKKKLQEMEGSGGQSVAPKVENAADNAARVIDRLSASAQQCAEATEAETAKKRLQEIEGSGGGAAAPAVENSAERMARSMDKASAATERHAEAAEKSSGNLLQVAKSFGGMAIGMAAQYAANNMDDGPGKTALGYGASIAQGASMGMMFGPWGALAGAALGAGKQFIANDAEEKAKQQAAKAANAANRETLETWEKSRSQTLAFKAAVESLTNSERPLADRQREIAAAIEERMRKDERLRAGLQAESGVNGDAGQFGRLMRDRQANAGELDALKQLAKQLEAEGNKERGGSAADYSAVDALARIGGSFAGGGGADTMRNLEQNSKDQLTVLREIRDKKTGGTF